MTWSGRQLECLQASGSRFADADLDIGTDALHERTGAGTSSSVTAGCSRCMRAITGATKLAPNASGAAVRTNPLSAAGARPGVADSSRTDAMVRSICSARSSSDRPKSVRRQPLGVRMTTGRPIRCSQALNRQETVVCSTPSTAPAAAKYRRALPRAGSTRRQQSSSGSS